MNGIIVINKNSGPTSHDIINKVRKIFKTKKVGHLGTLDPLASGVLVVCINDATKLVQFLENDSKEYIAEVLVGTSTDTFDCTGNIINDEEVNDLTNQKIDETLKNFLGKSKQLPPIYSAIKKDGKKLYEYAREGKDVEIAEREIEIYNIERISDVKIDNNKALFSIKVNVSKGTYIRSLCVDICKKLGYSGCMNNLIRTRSGKWSITDSSTIEEVEYGNYTLYSMLDAVSDFPFLEDEECIYKAKHGMKISANNVSNLIGNNRKTIVIKELDKIVAVYEYDEAIKGYRALRVWN